MPGPFGYCCFYRYSGCAPPTFTISAQMGFSVARRAANSPGVEPVSRAPIVIARCCSAVSAQAAQVLHGRAPQRQY